MKATIIHWYYGEFNEALRCVSDICNSVLVMQSQSCRKQSDVSLTRQHSSMLHLFCSLGTIFSHPVWALPPKPLEHAVSRCWSATSYLVVKCFSLHLRNCFLSLACLRCNLTHLSSCKCQLSKKSKEKAGGIQKYVSLPASSGVVLLQLLCHGQRPQKKKFCSPLQQNRH